MEIALVLVVVATLITSIFVLISNHINRLIYE